MFDNRIGADSFVILIDPGLVLGVSGIIQPSFPGLPLELKRYGSLSHADPIGNFRLGIFSAYENMNLMTIASRKSFLFSFFISQSYQKQSQSIKS